MTLPVISIITIVFNGEKYLDQTIRSVLDQKYPSLQYIIIDGGSTDRSLDIIKNYERIFISGQAKKTMASAMHLIKEYHTLQVI